MTDVEFTASDMAEARYMTLYSCKKMNIIPDPDMIQVASIGLWKLKNHPTTEETRYTKFRAVEQSIIGEVRRRLGRGNIRPQFSDILKRCDAGNLVSPALLDWSGVEDRERREDYEHLQHIAELEIARAVLVKSTKRVIRAALTGKSNEEIARQLGWAKRSVKERKCVALRVLRAAVQAREDGES